MSDESTAAGPQSIDSLPRLYEFIPDINTNGFPEDFAALFHHPRLRLLRGDESEVVVFRNKDLLGVAANPAAGNTEVETFRSRLGGQYGSFMRFIRNMVFTSNPPVHGPMRQAVARPLMPKQMPSLEPTARRAVADTLDEAIERGTIDLSTQFTLRVTSRFWGTLFGMTDDEVSRLAEVLHEFAALTLLAPTQEERIALDEVIGRYLDIVSTAIHRTLEDGGGENLLHAMVAGFAAMPRTIEPDRVGVTIAANVIDGLHTVAAAAANIIYQLLRRSDSLAALRANPALVANAVAEGLRMWGPVIVTRRQALQDLEYAGVSIPRGTAIRMLWAAGNRDPQVFENPNEFDLFRKPRSDTTFGGGVHVCPGRFTARMLVHAMLDGVLAPDIHIELSGGCPSWIPRSEIRHLDRVPVKVTRL